MLTRNDMRDIFALDRRRALRAGADPAKSSRPGH
jgi:hypothetical protein